MALTYGLTQAASQVTTTPAVEIARTFDEQRGRPVRRCSARACGSPRTSEILVARSHRRPPACSARTVACIRATSGALDDRGRLRVNGRKVDTIVSGGENVAPAEVEAVLEAHPQVLEAAVIGRSDPDWGEAVTAIVVARAGAVLDPESPARALRRPAGAVQGPEGAPARVRAAAAHASGKLLRRELK